MYFGCNFEKALKFMKRTAILITTVLASVLFANKALAQDDELVRIFRSF